MNTVTFIPTKPANRHLKPIAVLILVAAIPASLGTIFHSPWITWTGVSLIGIACLWVVIAAIRALVLPWPKYRLVRVNSKPMLDEFLRLGWTLREERRDTGANEPLEYLLEWLPEEDPPPPDLSKLSDSLVESPARSGTEDADNW